MKIIAMAIFILGVNVATAMVAASGAFPEGVAPANIEDLGTKLGNLSQADPGMSGSRTPTSGYNIIDIATGLGNAIVLFIGIAVNTPTAFAFLIGEIIPGTTTVESIFVGGLKLGMWVVYVVAVIQLLTGRIMEGT